MNTDMKVVEAIVTYDSKHAVVVLSDGDTEFELQEYDVAEAQLVFSKEYKGTYLKMNNIEQNSEGTVFAIAYQDNGSFYVNIITNTGKEIDTVEVSKALSLDDKSKPVTGFMEPLITCCFTGVENQLFI